MKNMIFSAAAALLLGVMPLYALNADCADIPEISAKGAVLISADTGEVVFGENYSRKLPMASTTKIMTTLLCIESGGLYDEFVVDSEAIKVEGSSMGLQEGDIVTKYALCCGMLLPSGNDAANAAAVRIAGSIPAFADMMNDRARKMGLSRTYFVTPSGLEGDGHGSSAYDMAVLASEALRLPLFREICSKSSLQLEFGNPPYKRWLKNTNKLLTMYDGVYGVKTGFTDEAGRCLVSACEKDGKNLICVTLNDRNDWNDHISMYDFGFDKASLLTLDIPDSFALDLAGSTDEHITVSPDSEPVNVTVLNAKPEDFELAVIAPPFVYAPVKQGDELAELSVRFNGREIRRLPLYADSDAEYFRQPEEKNEDKNMLEWLFNKLFG